MPMTETPHRSRNFHPDQTRDCTPVARCQRSLSRTVYPSLTTSLFGLRLSVFRAASISPLFFFNDTATTEIYTLSLHDALPIWSRELPVVTRTIPTRMLMMASAPTNSTRSEEHTSELQSRLHLVCRLLLEKKKNKMRCL